MNRKLIEYLFREIVRVENNIVTLSKQDLPTAQSAESITIKLQYENRTLDMLGYIVDSYLNQFEK